MSYSYRYEVLLDINKNCTFDEIINKGKNPTEKGFIYEILSIICLISKQLIPTYTNISDTNIEGENLHFRKCESIKPLFDKSIIDGDNKSDISIQIEDKWVPFSIKHGPTKRSTDLSTIKDCLSDEKSKYKDMFSLGLIYESEEFLVKHRHPGNREKIAIDIAKNDGNIFNKKNVQDAYLRFQKILISNNFNNIQDIIDWIDKEYLVMPGRKHLQLKFNQALALLQYKKNMKKSLIHCLYHKPRSGKTITMLLYAQYLLDNGYKRILIISPIPDTLKNFTEELDKYYEFKEIKYKTQDNYLDIDKNFIGICLCSVQYLKRGNKKGDNKLLKEKKEKLKLFDCNIFDECHFHSSNDKTLNSIINVHKNKEIMKIFGSGTPGKTNWFYDISSKYVYKWSISDEAFMKKNF